MPVVATKYPKMIEFVKSKGLHMKIFGISKYYLPQMLGVSISEHEISNWDLEIPKSLEFKLEILVKKHALILTHENVIKRPHQFDQYLMIKMAMDHMQA